MTTAVICMMVGSVIGFLVCGLLTAGKGCDCDCKD